MTVAQGAEDPAQRSGPSGPVLAEGDVNADRKPSESIELQVWKHEAAKNMYEEKIEQA